MCADDSELEAMEPALVLSLDSPMRPMSLRCEGTLDRRTQRHFVAAVEEMLRSAPDAVSIDVAALRLADSDGANALIKAQRAAHSSGTALRWRGVGADLLRRAPALDYRPGARRARGNAAVPLAQWSDSPRAARRSPRVIAPRPAPRGGASRHGPYDPADAPPRAS